MSVNRVPCRPGPSHSGAPSRTHRLVAAALVAGSLVTGACYQDPQQILDQQQLITDMSDAVNDIALRIADMQVTIDSLTQIVARQDSAIYRMANVTGIPYQLR